MSGLEQMSRDELEERVEELEDTVEELEQLKDTLAPAIARVLNDMAGREGDEERPIWSDVEMVPVASEASKSFQTQQDQLETMKAQLERHETEIENGKAVASDEQGNYWEQVVNQAQNCQGMREHDIGNNWVILYKEDVAKAIGPGEKRASQLIDEWTDVDSGKYKQGTEKQPYKPPASARNNKPQKKAIRVDLDVWGDSR